jgi:hypothetical protein
MQFAQDPSIEVRRSVGWNKNASEEILTFLLKEGTPEVLETIAANSGAPGTILEVLANSSEKSIRLRLAKNPGLPHYVLDQLASNEDIEIKQAAQLRFPRFPRVPAQEYFVNADTLSDLFGSDEKDVQLQIASDPEFPFDIIDPIPTRDSGVRRRFARNPSLSERWMEVLAVSHDFALRLAIAAHPAISPDLLEYLSHDVQPSVRELVAARNRRGGGTINPIRGEILSAGEILWYLVTHEGESFDFVISWDGDSSLEYVQWFDKHWEEVQKLWNPLIVGPPFPERRLLHTWCYHPQIIEEFDIIPHYYHLALHGLRGIAIGWMPCIYWGPSDESKEEIKEPYPDYEWKKSAFPPVIR